MGRPCARLRHAVWLKVCNRAGWTDRTMHLVWPNISPVKALFCRHQGRFNVAFVDQPARLYRPGAQSLLQITEILAEGPRLPSNLQSECGLGSVLFALCDDADKVALRHDCDDAGNMSDRCLVNALETAADELAAIKARVRRSYDPAMKASSIGSGDTTRTV